jgi:cysteine synthase A
MLSLTVMHCQRKRRAPFCHVPQPSSSDIGETIMLYDDITQTIGRTPVVRIQRLAPSHVKMYVKLEAANPGGSVKDRLGLGIIQDAERRGALKPGQTVVEATSGNTGIALALVCAARGYPFVAIMPESFSVERRQIMRAFGAKVVLTPAAERASGAVRVAERLAEERGWFLARQFDNEANPAFHRQTTGAEILSDFASERLDYWVTGWGTGGTLTGAGQVIRCARPETKIIACEPASAALLAGQQWKPHKIQGWTPDFVPTVLDRDVFDEVLSIEDERAVRCARDLAQREGIFCGISSGGTFAAALQVAAKAEEGSVILAMLPDTGERYLSTVLFEGMPTGSDSI